jgi:hypothetical protein
MKHYCMINRYFYHYNSPWPGKLLFFFFFKEREREVHGKEKIQYKKREKNTTSEATHYSLLVSGTIALHGETWD